MGKQPRNRRREGFLADYKLDDTYTVKPDPATGRAGLIGGFSPDGLAVLIKVWRRKKEAQTPNWKKFGGMSCGNSIV